MRVLWPTAKLMNFSHEPESWNLVQFNIMCRTSLGIYDRTGHDRIWTLDSDQTRKPFHYEWNPHNPSSSGCHSYPSEITQQGKRLSHIFIYIFVVLVRIEEQQKKNGSGFQQEVNNNNNLDSFFLAE